MPARDLGVLVEDHVGSARVAADDDLDGDGHLGAGELTGDEGEQREGRISRPRAPLLHGAIVTDRV